MKMNPGLTYLKTASKQLTLQTAALIFLFVSLKHIVKCPLISPRLCSFTNAAYPIDKMAHIHCKTLWEQCEVF
nr:unnamed protein product [Spirometra erinaceieuropaei]